ncbi:hypothetical protein LWI28_002675 [Acer negundo]|uniref:Timeless N-terminal domain-containing protein n=1 Tax=Acer negundo TaxID=4023 RepID=A0AAD5IBT0_ACENE|nr:hypothetical protein LWI28_002675 [Acer negundo]
MDMEGLSVICAGIGLADEDEIGNRIGYSPGEYCLDNLKDLLRFLRRDDPQTREVFKQVCKWNIVSKDLIPIFEYCQDDRNLVLNAVKVLVFLTMPIEPSSNDIPQQIEYLWGLKSAITCSDTVAVIVSLLEGPLQNLECEAFTEDDWKLVQLVLTFFRNILAIQDIPPHQKAGGSASEFVSLRDKFMELLFNENVMDIIIVIAQHVGGSRGHFRHDNLLLLETFHYISWSRSRINCQSSSEGFQGNICGPIASSMDDSMFQLVISKWRYAFDGLKETKEYKFLSAAGSLMKNMIRMLDLVLKLLPEDSKEPQTARILLYKLFYDQTDQGVTQFLLNLIKAFDTHKQPKSDLADLVEMICVLVRLMEKLQARGTLRVSRKSRRGRKKEVMKSEKEAESEGKKEVLNGEKEAESEGKKEVLNGEKEAEIEGKKEVSNGEKEAESEGKQKVLKGEKEAEIEVSGSHATIQDDICISK